MLGLELERAIRAAWLALRGKILSDPQELRRRLARRRMKSLTRPPRAWCIAIRASDRRITPAHWVIAPEHAMELDHPEHPYEPIEHEVTIQPHGLRRFCRAVRTDSWGELVEDVAKRLGVNRKSGLDPAREQGVFTERFVKGLGGRRGQYPVPLIHSWKTLDPSGPKFERPNALWGALWEFLPDMVPDNFEQTVVRPIFKRMTGRSAVDVGQECPTYRDEMRFWGWSWVCPACRKTVKKIYYPIAPRGLFDFLGYDPARATMARAQSKKYLPHDVEDVAGLPGTFACGKCHGVVHFVGATVQGWNMVVSWLTRWGSMW